jgi:ribosomal protein S18 acetylase RimI-like enzyme
MTFPTDEASDVDAAVAIFASAFYHDPVWSWAFSDIDQRTDQLAQMWRLLVTQSEAMGHLWIDRGAAAAWFPPGAQEISEADQARLPQFLEGLIGSERAGQVMALWSDFEAARPAEPHFYLSLLGTHADDRGRGQGMQLLRDSMAKYAGDGFACYLESSNPANNARYASVGFEPHGKIVVGHGVPDVTTMWRPAQM